MRIYENQLIVKILPAFQQSLVCLQTYLIYIFFIFHIFAIQGTLKES